RDRSSIPRTFSSSLLSLEARHKNRTAAPATRTKRRASCGGSPLEKPLRNLVSQCLNRSRQFPFRGFGFRGHLFARFVNQPMRLLPRCFDAAGLLAHCFLPGLFLLLVDVLSSFA